MSVTLDKIVDISVEISKSSAISSDFTLGLIIGSTANQAVTAANRVKVYDRDGFVAAMVADGYSTDSPEVLGATAYFAQDPSPASVAIGYMATDETPADALTACRNGNKEFYAVAFVTALDASQMVALGTASGAFDDHVILFFHTADENCLTTGTNNPMKTLQDAALDNAVIAYSEKDTMLSSRVMGKFCGLNSMTPGSAYTMAYKTLVGATPDNLSTSQMKAIEGYNGNAYTNFGRRYNLFYPGKTSNGSHIDQIFFVDAAKFLIQQYTVAGLIPLRRVPQTEDGLSQIVSFIVDACSELATIGFIATGIWNGGQVLELNPGDAVPGGFFIQTGDMATQSAQDRANRVTPPIYVALKSSGAFEHVVIKVYVNE